MINRFKLSAVLALASLLHAVPGLACTNFMLKGPPGSGAIASARTVDFNIPIVPKVQAISRGQAWQSRGDSIQPPGATWINRYGFVAVAGSNEPNLFLDGINEKGLGAAILWLDETKHMGRKGNGSNDVSAFDLVSYVVGQYASAGEAKAALRNVNVYGTFLSEYNMVIPLHLVVMDANGDSFVAEWIDGQLQLHDKENTEGYVDVLANSPPYEQQLLNLADYDDLSCYNTDDRYALTGLPGNSSSTSRFVRVAKLKQCAEHVGGDPNKPYLIETEDEALERAQIVIGRVDKPEGEVVTEPLYGVTLSFTRILIIRIHGKPDRHGRSTAKLYFNTPENQSLRLIDLAKLDFNASRREEHGIKSYYVDSPMYRRAQDAIPMRR